MATFVPDMRFNWHAIQKVLKKTLIFTIKHLYLLKILLLKILLDKAVVIEPL